MAVEVPIVGDAKRVLQSLTGLVDAVDPSIRADYFASWPNGSADSVASSWHGSGAWRDGLLSADFVVERIGELTDHQATYVADVGQNQMWLALCRVPQPEQPRQLGRAGHDGLLRQVVDGGHLVELLRHALEANVCAHAVADVRSGFSASRCVPQL